MKDILVVAKLKEGKFEKFMGFMQSEEGINERKKIADLTKNFIKGKGKGSDYFLNFDEPFDTSKVVRPRTSDLLNPVKTTDGIKYIWCTFSKDQVDLNFAL